MKFFTGCWYSDNAIMFQYIDEIEVKSGSDRNKILYVNPRKGGSNLYGYTWKSYMSPTKSRQKVEGYDGLYITEMRRKNPEFAEIAKEFRDYISLILNTRKSRSTKIIEYQSTRIQLM